MHLDQSLLEFLIWALHSLNLKLSTHSRQSSNSTSNISSKLMNRDSKVTLVLGTSAVKVSDLKVIVTEDKAGETSPITL